MMLHHGPRRLVVILVVVAVLALVGGAYLVWAGQQQNGGYGGGNMTPTATPAASFTIAGEIACLPYPDDGQPHTLECAFGLHGDDGYYYALIGLEQQQLIDGTLQVGVPVLVHGSLQPPDVNEKYAIRGEIVVEDISAR